MQYIHTYVESICGNEHAKTLGNVDKSSKMDDLKAFKRRIWLSPSKEISGGGEQGTSLPKFDKQEGKKEKKRGKREKEG